MGEGKSRGESEAADAESYDSSSLSNLGGSITKNRPCFRGDAILPIDFGAGVAVGGEVETWTELLASVSPILGPRVNIVLPY